jgi:hypothetical protein
MVSLAGSSPDPASPLHGPGVAGASNAPAGARRGVVRTARVDGTAVMPR